MYLCLLLLAAGCGLTNQHNYLGFEGYVNSFVFEAGMRNVDIDVSDLKIYIVDHFSSEKSADVVGVCYYSDTHIELLKSNWIKSSSFNKELLLFHEMGHCLLEKSHTHCPNVMCSQLMDIDEYKENRKQYLDVLFE